MYISQNYISFHSDVFGSTTLVLPIEHVVSIARKKSFMFVNDAVEIVCDPTGTEAEVNFIDLFINIFLLLFVPFFVFLYLNFFKKKQNFTFTFGFLVEF